MYLKYLEQRNNYLKQIKIERKSDEILEIWDEKLAEYAEKVYNYRIIFINQIKRKINAVHSSITDEKEEIELEYISDYVNMEQFKNTLHDTRKNDIFRGFTTKGIHKDDFPPTIAHVRQFKHVGVGADGERHGDCASRGRAKVGSIAVIITNVCRQQATASRGRRHSSHHRHQHK